MNIITIFSKRIIEMYVLAVILFWISTSTLNVLVQAGGLTGQRNIRTVEKRKYLSLPDAVSSPSSPRADLFSTYFSAGAACEARDGGEGGWSRFVFWLLTSLISFILAPPLPMREPHWLAGMTSRRVTGGLELMVPLATNAVRSWTEIWGKRRKMCWESAGRRKRERESQRKRSGGRGQGVEKSR